MTTIKHKNKLLLLIFAVIYLTYSTMAYNDEAKESDYYNGEGPSWSRK